jgi:2-phosphoglycerate kinase
MIYLIGGPPRCGKTTLAEALGKRTSAPVFSIDHLGAVISPYIPADQQRSAFPMAAARAKAGGSNDAFHASHAPTEIVELYLRQAETYWPGVESFVRYGLRDEHELILEGWQLLPRMVSILTTPENRDRLSVLFLFKKDANQILSGLKSGQNDWVTRHTRNESTFLAIAEMIAGFGGYTEAEAERNQLRAVNTESDFEEKIASAVNLLSRR